MNLILLKESLHMITPQREEFARHMYAQLFKQYPQTRALFPASEADMRKQEELFISMLEVVVAGMVRGENMTEELRSLGERHYRYGTRTEHYPVVGQVLIQTFYDLLGDAFTPQMKATWVQAYEIISSEMLKGAEQVSSL